MSLINDALKRARQAQRPPPEPLVAGPPFRPVEAGQVVPRRMTSAAQAGLAIVAVLVLAVVWHWTSPTQGRSQRASTPTPTRPAEPVNLSKTDGQPAKPAAPATVVPAAQASPPTVQDPGTPGRAPRAEAASPQTVSRASGPAQVVSLTSAGASNVVASTAGPLPATASTNVAAATSKSLAVGKPSQEPLKLQGIVLDPRRPSAMINGRTLFIGDTLGDLELVAIDQESATLVGAGKTNILDLEP